jgi:hypothetical protein
MGWCGVFTVFSKEAGFKVNLIVVKIIIMEVLGRK